jgi:hypothetical protein
VHAIAPSVLFRDFHASVGSKAEQHQQIDHDRRLHGGPVASDLRGQLLVVGPQDRGEPENFFHIRDDLLHLGLGVGSSQVVHAAEQVEVDEEI